MLVSQPGGFGHLVCKNNNILTVQILPALFCCDQFSKLTISFIKYLKGFYERTAVLKRFLHLERFRQSWWLTNSPKVLRQTTRDKNLLTYFLPQPEENIAIARFALSSNNIDFLAPLPWFTARQNDLTL